MLLLLLLLLWVSRVVIGPSILHTVNHVVTLVRLVVIVLIVLLPAVVVALCARRRVPQLVALTPGGMVLGRVRRQDWRVVLVG